MERPTLVLHQLQKDECDVTTTATDRALRMNRLDVENE